MAKTINADFQAAPFLGESSFDPNEFMRRYNTTMYQQKRVQQMEESRDTKAALDKLSLDVKAWDDKKGFEEITKKKEMIQKTAIEIMGKKINWVNPKTRQDMAAYKGVNDALNSLKRDVDVWNENKIGYDLIQTEIKKQLSLPEDERTMNIKETQANLQKELSDNDIANRNLSLDKIVKYDIKPKDIIKKVLSSKDFFEKGTQTQNVIEMPDGSKQVSMSESLTPEQEKENIKRAGIMYEGLTDSYKLAVKKMRDADPDPDMKVLSDKDYFSTIAVPTYKDKLIRRPVGSSSGGSGINFGGANIKYEPTERQAFRNYKTYHPTLKWPTQNIPVDDVIVWKPNGEKVRVTKKTLQLQYTGYDEETDQLTFLTESNYYGGDQLGKGDQIAMQSEDVPPEFKDIEILVEGKKVKIKDVKREKPSAPKVSYPDWKKANPSGTLDQYKAVNGL
jgi:hypothetical protein